jgi:nucleoside-triphosphatase THEP1
MDVNHLYLLTAPRGAGKTTFCRALVDQARVAGWDVAGVLSPPVFENGVKTGIRAENLRTNESLSLAVSITQSPITNYDSPLGQWLFSSANLNWGNEIFAASLPCDLFIVDELGPLELIRGEGWLNALEALRQPKYKIGIVVIRPELVEIARQMLPIIHVITLEPSEHSAQYANFWWKKMCR